ncbi:MAG: sodium:calcium antiporter [Chloroflexi bacterium]|nr:sodium:calcium antiporter [Chloroflexota bacterium]
MHPLAALGLFLAGLVLLERGADLFNDRVGELVERTGASETVVGLLTVGMEWEELLVSLVAAFSGSPGIAVGNVIGASIANLTGSFSLGVLARPIAITGADRVFAGLTLALTLLAAGFLTGGEIGRGHGAILSLIFLAYLGGLIVLLARGLARIPFEREEEEGGHHGPLADLALAFGGLALILLGAEAVVQAGVALAGALGLSEYVIGLTLVAIGTTLPDKVISITGALRGRSGVVVANALGSNIFNLYAVLGLAALVAPLVVDEATRAFDVPFLVSVTLLTALLFLRQSIGRGAGVALLVLYMSYLYVNFWVKG